MTIKNMIRLVGIGSTVAFMAGCASPNQAVASRGAAPAAATADAMPPCPFEIPGTSATEQETADGIVIEFANEGHADEVRQRVRARAAYMKAHPKPVPVQMTKELEDSPNGIRMIVHAVDPAKVEDVRKVVREQLAQARAQSTRG